jgi:hypothetical protein
MDEKALRGDTARNVGTLDIESFSSYKTMRIAAISEYFFEAGCGRSGPN